MNLAIWVFVEICDTLWLECKPIDKVLSGRKLKPRSKLCHENGSVLELGNFVQTLTELLLCWNFVGKT